MKYKLRLREITEEEAAECNRLASQEWKKFFETGEKPNDYYEQIFLCKLDRQNREMLAYLKK